MTEPTTTIAHGLHAVVPSSGTWTGQSPRYYVAECDCGQREVVTARTPYAAKMAAMAAIAAHTERKTA